MLVSTLRWLAEIWQLSWQGATWEFRINFLDADIQIPEVQ